MSYSADVPCSGSLPSSDLFNHVCDLSLFSYPRVCFLSRYVMFSILLLNVVGAVASLFFAWLVNGHISACYKYARVLGLSLQACSHVTFEDIAVLDECLPFSRDSSLNLFVWYFCLWCCTSHV